MNKKLEFLALIEQSKISKAINFALSAKEDREVFLAAIGDHFFASGNLSAAKSFYVHSLRSKPNPSAEFGLGSVLLSGGEPEKSLKFFSCSSKDKRYEVNSMLKMGLASRLIGDIKGSLDFYLKASSKGYKGYILHLNIATLLSDLGEFEKASEHYELGILLAPEDHKARLNYSMHLLSLGDFSRGLEFYESRPWCFKGKGLEWSGSHGENVLVISEQGYGDLIHFCRFIKEVAKVSNKVALACDPKLFGLMSTLGCLDEIFPLDQESIDNASDSYPRYCRVMSIPYLMGLKLPPPETDPYLKPDCARSSFWKDYLSGDAGLKVGLCWQGGKRDDPEMIFNDRRRSIDLKALSPVLDIEGVNFYSLQKDWMEYHPKIKYPMKICGDFLDTASLISNLDLVISVDTSIAHVAGSLGVPVWMMSRLGGCWRWGLESPHTFWYPSMRIFRQKAIDDWEPVANDIALELLKITKT
jgi:tetratricopeptide (TPR) repeat protein